MDRTPNLDLPYILPSQAQKHVTHNEAIRALDAIAQAGVVSRSLDSPAETPAEGDRYIVAAGASGDWSEHDLEIAAWQDGAWMFYAAKPGWAAWIGDEAVLVVWNGSSWLVAGGTMGEFDSLSVNGAAADAINRIAANAPATLLSHNGNGHQLKINKNAIADTASVLFQTSFSGHAEFGLTGDDNWHVKVSPDCSTWHESIVVDSNTGNIGLGIDTPTRKLHLEDESQATFIQLDNFGTNNQVRGRQARGTKASPAATLATDILFSLSATGHDGDDFTAARGLIAIRAEENFSGLAQGTYVSFDTTAAGTTARSEKLRIAGNGNVGIGTNSPATTLDINGPAKVKSYTVAEVPSASTSGAGSIIFISDEAGGAVLAFSDGIDWRRATDRAVIA